MITDKGKSIITKYMLGQTPSYASYIAIGCGARPVTQMSFNVTNKQLLSHIATLTIGTHDFIIGDYITVSNIDTTFNGVYQITAIAENTISFSNPGTNVSSSSVTPVGRVTRNYSNKTALDFEMLRVPITSKGYVKENGVSKLVLTANIPAPERYEISEIGVFPARSNPAAQSVDGQTIFNFSSTEGWEYHSNDLAGEINFITNRLDSVTEGIIDTYDSNFFIANSSNITFSADLRLKNNERPRNLDETIFISGNECSIIKSTQIVNAISNESNTAVIYTTQDIHNLAIGDIVTFTGMNPSSYDASNATVTSVDAVAKTFTLSNDTTDALISANVSLSLPRLSIASGGHIHNANNILFPFNNAAGSDELRTAFSIIARDQETVASDIDSVRLSFSFRTSGEQEQTFAQMDIELTSEDVDFTGNRYFSVSKQLQELSKVGSFNWDLANIVIVNACVIVGGNPSSDYIVALDGLRFENVSSKSPTYGLVGYSVIDNPVNIAGTNYGQAIPKLSNTSSFIEFRYTLDVL